MADTFFNEGIWQPPDSSGSVSGEWGRQTEGQRGWGGVADSGAATSASGFVIIGIPTNRDPVAAASPSSSAHYYQGYWAGVQGALYGLQSQVNPFLSFGLTPPFASFPYDGFARNYFDIVPQPPTSRSRARATATATSLSNVSHPFGMWLTPDVSANSWFLGSGIGGEFPLGLPDWGERPSGPLLPSFSPIAGQLSDFEQQIRDAGNPDLWLSSREVGPMVPSLSRPGPEFFDPTPITTPFDVTPGNTSSVTTPENIPQGITRGNPNGIPALLYDWGGPRTYFDMFQ